MTAAEIQGALRYRHSKDLYISECKNGPTQSIGARPIRLDGWAFLKTWSPVTSIGYEVKVSRSDFLNDGKWPDYLPLCHLFYFVAPKGVIQLAELPDGIGLMEAIGGQNGNTPRIVTRRKSIYRVVDANPAYLSLLHYVLMCRVRLGGTWVDAPPEDIDKDDRRQARIDEWDRWLGNRKDAEAIGRRVTRAVRDELDEMRGAVSLANAKVAFYDATRRTLQSLGFDPDKPLGEWGLEKRIQRAAGVVTPELIDSLERAKSGLAAALTEFARIQQIETEQSA